VVPAYVTAQPGRRNLAFEEREEIFAGVERGDSIRLIARSLGRAPSTVQRELRLNMRHQQYRRRSRHGFPATKPWRYRPSQAQFRAEFMTRRPKTAKLAANPELRELVQAKLKERLSPQQISVELRQEFPDNPEMWVSHETIYQSIYVQARGALRRELAVHLRTGRALRKPRRRANERRGRIPDMVNISQRPAEPDFIWKSLTWDQGKEMSNHLQIKVATGLQVYFCDPASPWQRGSNENTNGLLRQYFPKGDDLSQHGPEHLDFVAAQMNRRPRETLGWTRPAEALGRLLSTASQLAGVATTE
jgi:IS30 family transposase